MSLTSLTYSTSCICGALAAMALVGCDDQDGSRDAADAALNIRCHNDRRTGGDEALVGCSCFADYNTSHPGEAIDCSLEQFSGGFCCASQGWPIPAEDVDLTVCECFPPGLLRNDACPYAPASTRVSECALQSGGADTGGAGGAGARGGSCRGWRQTSRCVGTGPREPENDKDCDALIDNGSGYCDCDAGRVYADCQAYGFATCNEVCTAGAWPPPESSGGSPGCDPPSCNGLDCADGFCCSSFCEDGVCKSVW